MRTVRTIGLLLAMAWAPAAAQAQPGKYSATVIIDGMQMRAGGSWQFPATGKLKKGEQVIIAHEDGAWIAITPPLGSVSWVNHRFLGEFDANATGKQNALIMADGVEVRVGSDASAPLAASQVKLPRGTIVEIVGAKVQADNSTWYPITPPAGEVRWLPKEAIGQPSPLGPPPVFVKSTTSPFSPPASGSQAPGSLTSFGKSASDGFPQMQWDKAEQAERSGDYITAEKLYTLIHKDLQQKKADAETLLLCYNRIIKCQDRIRLDATSPRPSLILPASTDARPSAALLPPTSNSANTTGAAAQAAASTGTGSLRRAPFQIDGKQAYALQNNSGQVLYYVTAAPTVGLDAFINRQVELLGVTQVRGDIRGGQYMVVTQVVPR
jgi:uncharacterized protein YraI